MSICRASIRKDLDHASQYIAEKLHNPHAALALLDAIEDAILKRVPNAESFEKYRSRKERRYPYFRIHVKGYVVFYVVREDDRRKVMEVRRLLHELQDREGKV